MKLKNIGPLIASRTLKDGENTVTILVGKPKKFPGGTDYFCPYQIIGLSDDAVRYGGGADAVQALCLTLECIGVRLYTSKEYGSGTLSWFEGSGDLGFPLPDNCADLKRP